MARLIVRRLLIDLERPFSACWNGGEPFSSALFNALSMCFPKGEQYFIDSIRTGFSTLSTASRDSNADEIQAFLGQEATHRRIHALFNVHVLQSLGASNWIEAQIQQRASATAGRPPIFHVANTAAFEHLTAVLSDWLLRHPQTLAAAEPRLQHMWMWHCAEECEHRSTAINLYRAMNGSEQQRIKVFKEVVTWLFWRLAFQVLLNLWYDRAVFSWRTWRNGFSLLFGADGCLRASYASWKAYLNPAFHPSQHDGRAGLAWLAAHKQQYANVGERPVDFS